MKISLVIPAHNEEKYIGACLESVAKNGTGLFEVIVVNNASTDKTGLIARGFPGVRVVTESAKGLTKARQKGFMEAQGDVIAFIDADAKMPQGWVKALVRSFEGDPEAVCVSGPYNYYDLSSWRGMIIWPYWLLLAWPAYLFTGYLISGGNFAVKKHALEAVNGFDESISFYGEDTDIARRLHRVGKVKFTPRLHICVSGRRIKEEGVMTAALRYSVNFLSVAFARRPVTNDYRDIR